MSRYHIDHVTGFTAFPHPRHLVFAFHVADLILLTPEGDRHTHSDQVAISLDRHQQWLLRRILEAKLDGTITCTDLDRALAKCRPDPDYPDHPPPRQQRPLHPVTSYAAMPLYHLLPFDGGQWGNAHYNPVSISSGFADITFWALPTRLKMPVDSAMLAPAIARGFSSLPWR
jgi:hypothetical protein